MSDSNKDRKSIAALFDAQLDDQHNLLKYQDPSIAVKIDTIDCEAPAKPTGPMISDHTADRIEIDSMAQYSHDLYLKPGELNIKCNVDKTFSGYCTHDVQFIYANNSEPTCSSLRQKQYGFQRTVPVPVIVGSELCTLPSTMLRFQRPFSDALRLDSKIKAGIKLNIGYVFDPKCTNNFKKYYYIKS